MTTPNRLAVAAIAFGLAGVPLTAAGAHEGGRGHGHGHGYGHHYGRGDHYRPYAYYRYAPARYVYVRHPVYTRVIYDDDYPYYDYPRPYRYVGYRSYARPGLSVSVGYADGPYYAGYSRWYPY